MEMSETCDAAFNSSSSSLDGHSKSLSAVAGVGVLVKWVFGVKYREVLEDLEGVYGGLSSREPLLSMLAGGVMRFPEG